MITLSKPKKALTRIGHETWAKLFRVLVQQLLLEQRAVDI
jgi:hypothetical protein